MYPITSRRWFFPVVLALFIVAEFLALRADWGADTQSDVRLSKLQVRSGYSLMLETHTTSRAEPILSYNATNQHNHRLMVDIQNARLSDESLRLLATIHPPNTPGRLIYAPDPAEAKSTQPPCRASFRIESPPETTARSRFVTIAPPKATDVLDRATTRLVHLSSHTPLTVRMSANSTNGIGGSGCRNLLSIGNWQQVIGKDLEVAFLVDPQSMIDVTLSSPSFESGKDEVESLEIEPLQPYKLTTHPLGFARVIQSRVYAGPPSLTLTDLRLGGDFFDVQLSGKAGIPLPEFLGWATWPLVALLDLPLLFMSINVFRLKKTIFLSYSWADRERVMPVYERLKKAKLDVWIDHEQLRSGVDWEENIRQEMLKARRILIFLSPSINDGGFLLTELGLARAIANDRAKHKTFIIPVRLEKCSVPPFFPSGTRLIFLSRTENAAFLRIWV